MAGVITRADRILLVVFAAVSAVFGVVSLVAGALRLQLYLTASSNGTPVSLLTDAAPIPSDSTDPDPQIVFGVFPTADLLVRGLSDTTRALLATGEGIGALVTVVVSAAIAYLFVSMARRRPFARALYVLALIAGATLALGSMLGQAIAGFGRMNAAVELNPLTDDLFRVGFSFDPAPIAIGFAIMGLAYVFRTGHRLQRDQEGLI